MTAPDSTPATPRPEKKSWLRPLTFVLLIVVPVVILLGSNTQSAELNWLGFEWRPPLWLVLLVTFAAGAVVTRLFGAAWRFWWRQR
ncbi:MAG: lipopolysaccharide assembly protein LapA domain-containing protein [Acidimicrobiia bacterium]